MYERNGWHKGLDEALAFSPPLPPQKSVQICHPHFQKDTAKLEYVPKERGNRIGEWAGRLCLGGWQRAMNEACGAL